MQKLIILIHFQQREVKDLRHPKPYGFVIANPPYGERLEDQETLPQLYTEMKEAFDRLDTWSKYVITSYEDTEKYLGKPTKKRKVYNGMIRGEFTSTLDQNRQEGENNETEINLCHGQRT